MRTYRWVLVGLVVLVGLLTLSAQAVRAQGELPPEHVVQAGESLWSIALQYGLDVDTLVALNALDNPDQIFVGQHLRLTPEVPGLDATAWRAHRLGWGERLTALAHAGQVSWEQLALANRVLQPTTLPVGQVLYVPRTPLTTTLLQARPGDTWLGVALRANVPQWDVRRYNPQPFWREGGVLLPVAAEANYRPYPLVTVTLAPATVTRGESGVLQLTTALPLSSCRLDDYRNIPLPCHTLTDTQRVVLFGIGALVEPGTYPFTLTVAAAGVTETLVLPLPVAAGNYDFEQLEFDPDREALLASETVRQELAILDALRPLSTTARLWQYPFWEPLTNKPVTSLFGTRRAYGNTTGFSSYHAGVDYAAPVGTPVLAPADGVVVLAQPLMVRGNAIMLDHGWGVLTGYWHLSEIKVAEGQRVQRGDVIGLVGHTGLSTGPHLHWEMWVNGIPVNARQWLEAFAPLPAFPGEVAP